MSEEGRTFCTKARRIARKNLHDPTLLQAKKKFTNKFRDGLQALSAQFIYVRSWVVATRHRNSNGIMLRRRSSTSTFGCRHWLGHGEQWLLWFCDVLPSTHFLVHTFVISYLVHTFYGDSSACCRQRCGAIKEEIRNVWLPLHPKCLTYKGWWFPVILNLESILATMSWVNTPHHLLSGKDPLYSGITRVCERRRGTPKVFKHQRWIVSKIFESSRIVRIIEIQEFVHVRVGMTRCFLLICTRSIYQSSMTSRSWIATWSLLLDEELKSDNKFTRL